MIRNMSLPKHKRGVRADSTNNAPCTGCSRTAMTVYAKTYCPRHDAEGYADHMARHATDSIGPLRTPEEQARYDRYQSSQAWGR